MTVAELPHRHPHAWAAATRHPFLIGVREASLPEPAFATWLVQDYRFVTDLLWFQARLLARSPRSAQRVLADGASALVDELAWFELQAAAHGLDLTAPPLPATAAYRRLLQRLDAAAPAAALAMLWVIERAYLDAWSFAAPGAPAYQDFVTHWTQPGFGDYVAELAVAADAQPADGVDELAVAVLAAETSFWDMAWEAAR